MNLLDYVRVALMVRKCHQNHNFMISLYVTDKEPAPIMGICSQINGGYCINSHNCVGLSQYEGGNCYIECFAGDGAPSTPATDECNAGCVPEAECGIKRKII